MYLDNNISIYNIEEIDELIKYISCIGLVFHPIYFPDGTIDSKTLIQLEHSKYDIVTILDSNFCSYLYEIAKNGKCRDRDSEVLTGLVIAFTKYINANISFGFSLYENDSFGDSIPSIIKEKYANYLFSNTNFRFWLDIAEGNYEEIKICNLDLNISDTYRYEENDIHLLMHRISLIKLVCLYRRIKKENNFDLFIEFLNWYIDNMIISNAMIVYAALIFGNHENIKLPKNCNSDNISKILKGVENQAWDINQITQWSTFYTKENCDKCIYMFATNDYTLKKIIVESIYTMSIPEIVFETFSTKKQIQIINNIVERKLGENRVKPFLTHDELEINKLLQPLMVDVTFELKNSIESRKK